MKDCFGCSIDIFSRSRFTGKIFLSIFSLLVFFRAAFDLILQVTFKNAPNYPKCTCQSTTTAILFRSILFFFFWMTCTRTYFAWCNYYFIIKYKHTHTHTDSQRLTHAHTHACIAMHVRKHIYTQKQSIYLSK